MYGKYEDQGMEAFKSYSGLTLATQSDNDNYKDVPCNTFGYYARIYQESGECAFQKVNNLSRIFYFLQFALS